MDQIPQILRKFTSQIWYFLVLPVFFFTFILIYRPCEARTFFDAGRSLFAFNVTMCMCIMLVCSVLTRISFYYIWRKRGMSYVGYAFWCLGEIILMALFCSLYMWLISRRAAPYFSIVGRCLELSCLTLLYPYLIITLVLTLVEAMKRPVSAASDELVRFSDSQHRLKLVIAPSSILFIEAEENYVRIHYLESGVEKDYVLRNSMKSIEELVTRHGLARSHRSYFINPTHVKVLRKDKDGVILAELDSGAREIPVSKKYYDNISVIL